MRIEDDRMLRARERQKPGINTPVPELGDEQVRITFQVCRIRRNVRDRQQFAKSLHQFGTMRRGVLARSLCGNRVCETKEKRGKVREPQPGIHRLTIQVAVDRGR